MKKSAKSKLESLNKAVEVLRRGGVVILPTDTVYGIACKWNHAPALARIHRIKSSSQNFPILVADISQAHLVAKITPQILSLINKHWPGGLTLVVDSKKPGEKVGIRMPNSDVVSYITKNLNSPIIGTSANFHGQKAPRKKSELDPRLVNLVDLVVDGKCDLGVESTVVDTTVHPTRVLRQGAVKLS